MLIKKHTRDGNSTIINVKKVKEHFKIDLDLFIDEEPEPEVEIPIEIIQKQKVKKSKVVDTCHLDLIDE